MDANTDLTALESQPPRCRVLPAQAALMVGQYGRRAIGEKARAIAFLVTYLVAALVFVFRGPVREPVATSIGVLAVAVGLAFFIEGPLLGVMPLGEACGRDLSSKANLA